MFFRRVFATFVAIAVFMEKKKTFGTLRLHKESIEILKTNKRELERLMNKDLTWDEFILEFLANKSNKNK